jgi:hypothetical protein
MACKQGGFKTVDDLLYDWLEREPVEASQMIFEILDFARFSGIRTY